MNALLAAGLAVSLQFTTSPDDATDVVVTARPAPSKSSFSLHLEQESGVGPAMFARVTRSPDGLELKPAFRLEPGFVYRARLRLPDGEVLEKTYRVPPADPSPVPKVARILPASNRLPANLLKFYIEFSQPMREGRAIFDQIHLRNEDGMEVEAPWRRQELWSNDGRRLALWIHPGRIKRGVNLRETMGPVLLPGQRYRLVIDGGVRSAVGRPLGRDVVKEFATLDEDHVMPDPRRWELRLPRAGTREALRVTADECLDWALLHRCQWLEDAGGEKLAGELRVGSDGASWSWTPKQTWRAGNYDLCVDEWLEDLAGNTPARPFERDVNEPESPFKVIHRRFEIR